MTKQQKKKLRKQPLTISVDAAVAAVSSELSGIFMLKEERRKAPETFLGGCFGFTPGASRLTVRRRRMSNVTF